MIHDENGKCSAVKYIEVVRRKFCTDRLGLNCGLAGRQMMKYSESHYKFTLPCCHTWRYTFNIKSFEMQSIYKIESESTITRTHPDYPHFIITFINMSKEIPNGIIILIFLLDSVSCGAYTPTEKGGRG